MSILKQKIKQWSCFILSVRSVLPLSVYYLSLNFNSACRDENESENFSVKVFIFILMDLAILWIRILAILRSMKIFFAAAAAGFLGSKKFQKERSSNSRVSVILIHRVFFKLKLIEVRSIVIWWEVLCMTKPNKFWENQVLWSSSQKLLYLYAVHCL